MNSEKIGFLLRFDGHGINIFLFLSSLSPIHSFFELSFLFPLYLGYYILVVSVSGVFDIVGKRERRGRLKEEGMVSCGLVHWERAFFFWWVGGGGVGVGG